jgi:hypothetical protein
MRVSTLIILEACIALEATTEISVAGGSLNPGRLVVTDLPSTINVRPE